MKSLNNWNNLLKDKSKRYKDDNKVDGICELGSKREEEKSLGGKVWSEKKQKNINNELANQIYH